MNEVQRYLVDGGWVSSARADSNPEWGLVWKDGWWRAVMKHMTEHCGYDVLVTMARIQPSVVPSKMESGEVIPPKPDPEVPPEEVEVDKPKSTRRGRR